MNKYSRIFWGIFGVIITFSCYAIKGSYWQCISHDNNNMQWLTQSIYQLMAVNKAMDACKQQSSFPNSCNISTDDCEEMINGHSIQPMWQCSALDSQGKSWRSSYYGNQDSAAGAAKNNCQKNSRFPDTCYINFIACKNINAIN